MVYLNNPIPLDVVASSSFAFPIDKKTTRFCLDNGSVRIGEVHHG
jgi:hypothetical protein